MPSHVGVGGPGGDMLGRYTDEATEEAARALAASRSFDPVRHDPDVGCSAAAPCRLCWYDAAAAVAAALLVLERHRLDAELSVLS